jgi:uncharacterized membrane protein YdjX (TVP38/TMEM64 family)
MRLLLVFLGLAAVVLITFFIWGDSLMEIFSQAGTIAWLEGTGKWAWLLAVVLLMGDLLLPLPATLIMAAIGYIYGPIAGGLISAGGSFMAGSLGYWLCRSLGEKTARRLLGEKDYTLGKKLSGNVGGWVVVLSRWLPVFPEVISCMAGLTRMPAPYFHVALLCGSLPLGFIYAYIGHTGIEHPALSIGLSAVVPALIWSVIRPVFQKSVKDPSASA